MRATHTNHSTTSTVSFIMTNSRTRLLDMSCYRPFSKKEMTMRFIRKPREEWREEGLRAQSKKKKKTPDEKLQQKYLLKLTIKQRFFCRLNSSLSWEHQVRGGSTPWIAPVHAHTHTFTTQSIQSTYQNISERQEETEEQRENQHRHKYFI